MVRVVIRRGHHGDGYPVHLFLVDPPMEMLGECDHGYGYISGTMHALTLTHSWFFYWVRCWYCDLKIKAGPRTRGRPSYDTMRQLVGQQHVARAIKAIRTKTTFG